MTGAAIRRIQSDLRWLSSFRSTFSFVLRGNTVNFRAIFVGNDGLFCFKIRCPAIDNHVSAKFVGRRQMESSATNVRFLSL